MQNCKVEPGFFEGMEPVPGGIDAVERLAGMHDEITVLCEEEKIDGV